jgi:hypothetical protein
MNATLNLPSAESPLTPPPFGKPTRGTTNWERRGRGEERRELLVAEAHPKTSAVPFRNEREYSQPTVLLYEYVCRRTTN